MSTELVLQEIRGHVAILTLNQPEKLNALSADMAEEFHAKLDVLADEWPKTRAIVITGAGRGFCSGADVGNMPTTAGQKRAMETYGRHIIELAPHLRRIPQPVIAAVNGVAAGAGFALACVADVRIGAEEARFSSAFIKRSLVPDTALAYTLPRIVGQGVAHELMLTGRMVDAQFAMRTGILNRVVPAADLMKDAIAVAEEIAGNPPVVVRSTKKLLDSLWRDLAEIVWTEREYNRQTMGLGVKDRVEAVKSFMEKRKPVYTGE